MYFYIVSRLFFCFEMQVILFHDKRSYIVLNWLFFVRTAWTGAPLEHDLMSKVHSSPTLFPGHRITYRSWHVLIATLLLSSEVSRDVQSADVYRFWCCLLISSSRMTLPSADLFLQHIVPSVRKLFCPLALVHSLGRFFQISMASLIQ